MPGNRFEQYLAMRLTTYQIVSRNKDTILSLISVTTRQITAPETSTLPSYTIRNVADKFAPNEVIRHDYGTGFYGR